MKVFIIIVLSLLMASCRSTKNIQTAIAKKDTTKVAAPAVSDSAKQVTSVLQALDSNTIRFTTFSAKMGVTYRDAENKKFDLNANVRMVSDSAIWLSVNAILGIEAMRALITKDSVKLLDKHNKIYTARSINYLQEITSLPLDLNTLQNLIIGNAVFMDGNIVSYNQDGSSVTLVSLGQWFKNMLILNASNKTLLRSKLDDADTRRNRTADLLYSDYQNVNGVQFATKRKITVVEKKKLDIELDYKQYSFNDPVEFPFSIPKNYETR